MTFQFLRRSRERDIQQAQIRAVAASPLFDPDWYLRRYPDVAAAGEDPARHYALHGAFERRSPGPDFDAEAYLTSYPDVAASGVNPLLHYVQWGQGEGRDFNREREIRAVAESDLFDRDWYLQRYPDVAASDEDPARHYVLYGAAELRSPGPAFDTEAYVAAYRDVAASGVNPLLHYLQWGQAEGRDPRLEAQVRAVAASPHFDPDWYLQRYQDVAATGADPARHYVTKGAAEQRSPGPAFDAETYLSLYPDIAASGVNPLLHYLEWGQAEGRDLLLGARVRAVATSTLFNRDWYLRRYPDVAEAGLDPAWHYAVHGAAERRSPGPDFDGEGYLTAYPDVAGDGANPLLHYLRWGQTEGRDPMPKSESDRYERWIRQFDTLDDADRVAIRAHINQLPVLPVFSIVVPVYETDERYLREMLESVLAQIYPYWELCIADDASTLPHVAEVLEWFRRQDSRIKVVYRPENGHIAAASNSAVELATGDYVALLDHDDVLAPHALYLMAHAISEHPDADLIYSDQDRLDETGHRRDPHFKPNWNVELFYAQNFINHLGVYRTSLIRALGGFRTGFEGSQDYDLALRVTAISRGPIVHVPHVLYHWRVFSESGTFSTTQLDVAKAAARRAITEQLSSLGERVTVTDTVGSFHRVIHQEPARWPPVSIIIPTRDHIDVLAPCINGLLDETDYPDLEILIVDNDSSEPTTEAFFAQVAQRGVRILRAPGSFNFSRINNSAARQATGEILLFINNDTSVIHRSWLKEMMIYAARPGIGAVGARLLYPDGTVQHGGVILGLGGVAGHVHVGASGDYAGYFGRLKLAQDISCVTAACMAVPRTVFEEIGGFDEEHLAIAFNDVDLCIRIREAGYRIIWTPYAELCHYESKSRGPDDVPSEVGRFKREGKYIRERWGTEIANDPYFNANLSLERSHPEPGFPPRSRRPWLAWRGPSPTGINDVSKVETPPVMSRTDLLLGSLSRSARIIEIGPSFSPIAPKASGWNTSTLDHATRDSLVEKYRGQPGVDVARIEEVDFVWTSGPIVDAVPYDLHGTFDAFIASHVIEHTTDLIGFLDAAATLLSPEGVVILAVPDKRYCFDYFRPLTTTGEVLAAHAAQRSRHTRTTAFDHTAYVVKNNGVGAWGQAPIQNVEFFHSLEQAAEAFSATGEEDGSHYVDVHAWQFNPASFELLLLELARLGETDWRIERITPPTGCEFYVWLRRGGGAAAAALTNTELDSRRLALLKRIVLAEST